MTTHALKVAHQLPGRMRIEFPELYRNPFVCRHLEQYCSNQPGVREVRANPLTGRVLLVFEQERITISTIQALLRTAAASACRQREARLAQAATADGACKTVYNGAALHQKPRANQLAESSGLSTQLVHVGLTGALLATLLAKRAFYGRSPWHKSPSLFNLTAALTIVSGYPILRNGLAHLSRKGQVNHNLLISLATIILLVMRENLAGLSILWILHLSSLFRAVMQEQSHRSIYQMIAGKQRYAWVINQQGEEVRVPVHRLQCGDEVVIHAGERVPVDGELRTGTASVNQAAITGDSIPSYKIPGDVLYAGSIVVSGVAHMVAQRVGQETSVARTLQMVQRAERSKAPITCLAERHAQVLMPVTLGLAVLVYFLTRDFQRMTAMLIAGCPAAVALSTQTVLGMTVGRAAAEGILVKDTRALEEIAQIDTVLFDKTGTLTISQPQVTEILPVTKTISRERLLVLAASAEAHTNHPLAIMLVNEAKRQGLEMLAAEGQVTLDKGLRAYLDGAELLIGSEALMQEENIDLRRVKANAMRLRHLGSGVLYIAQNKKIVGLIGVQDIVRPENRQAVEMLRYEGIEHIGLITGDTHYAANNVAEQFGITENWSNCRPDEKVTVVEMLQKQGRRLAMVGDGINDAPALAAANVGIALGASGTAAALETADIVLHSDDPRGIAKVVHLSKQSLEIVRQNLALGVGLNVIGITLGAVRLISPMTAALVQNLSTLAVVLNSARILRKRKMTVVPALDLQAFGGDKKILTLPQRTLPVKAVAVQQAESQYTADWHTCAVNDVFRLQDVHGEMGLSYQEMAKRLRHYGPNKLRKAEGKNFWRVFLDQFNDIMVKVLLGACAVSVILKRPKDALLTAAIVIANAFMGAVQEGRAEKSMEALQKLSAPTARVVRNGRTQQVQAENLVPGDIVILEAGDRVPADCRLIEAVNLEVEESSLTGENLPVRKHTLQLAEKDGPLGDRKNMVFLGTIVTRGRARAVIVSTGMTTEMGRIAGMIQTGHFEQTPLQKRLEELGTYLVYGCLGIAALIFAAGLLRGEPFLGMLQTAASLTVAAIPEGLTAIVLIALAIGVQRMTRKNIIVRRMASIETLGCTTVICSDKTGTITKNEMTVRSLFIDGQWYNFTGEGYAPLGEIFSDGQPVEVRQVKGLEQALLTGALCNNAVLTKAKVQRTHGSTDKKLARKHIAWQINGDPTEGALLSAAAKAGLWAAELNKQCPRLRELPFEAERRMMSVITGQKGRAVMYSKGGTDSVLKLCVSRLSASGEVMPMNEADRQRIIEADDAMTRGALRVLALAYRPISDEETVLEAGEGQLIFVGLIGMIDPPRPEVFEAVRKCRQAGVKIVMITGDHPDTAAAIAREIGILGVSEGVLTGCELDMLDDTELISRVEKISVYARTSPQQKLRIIQALKSKDYIVAMTGDGVNDAPAVKAADVGIAMGRMGTDVTKEAAAMTLTDDNFATIVDAMEEGRSIYNNIRKAIRYLLATNIGEVVLMFLAVLLGLPLPLIPIQLLLINLVGDGLPAVALVNDPPSANIMSQPPRSGDESVFAGGLGKKVLSRGLAIGLGTLVLYAWKLASGASLMAARTVAIASLSIGQFIHIFDCRNEQFVGRVGMFSNPLLLGAVALSMTMVAGVIHLPLGQSLFQTVALRPIDWMAAAAAAALTAGLDVIFERFILSRQFVFPLPRPINCQEALR